MLVSIYPSFYAINQVNQKKKKKTMKSCICLFTTCMNSFIWMSTVVIYFKRALLQKYFKLVQTEKTSSFPLRLKTRMSCYTGATQSRLIKPCRYRHFTLGRGWVPTCCHGFFFGNGFRNFQVVFALSNYGHQQLSPFYHVENFDLIFFQIQGDTCLFFKVFIYCCYYLIRMY